ncbi:prohibitin family protein [bacterium]|nr:MAG: prohibitin family protein [bacterium]
MKSILATAAIVIGFILAISFFGYSVIGPGEVGIKVNYFGTQRGVEDFPLVTGMVLFNRFTTKVFHYPVYVQTAVWTQSPHEGRAINEEITFNSKEGLIIAGDFSLSYQLDSKKVPHFYVKFRSDNLDTFTHGFLRNVARDHFNEVGSQYAVDDIYGPKKEEFLKIIRERINKEVGDFGVHLEQFGFIGAPRLPQGVVDALNAKIKATQDAIRAENELRQAQAEAKKRVAAAEGEARSNEILTKSLTDTLIRWRTLEITQEAIRKWDGKRPMVEGSGAGLLLQIPLPATK